ncbi:3-oxoacyl-ACP reductase [Mycolicibacterium chitae]|uniref:3-oxoacyl-[acyl-carrier-protein] reductase MabA n=1 Tax=Mycolicibacterium chitae TaxID=1792 RepID=A0A448I360_MYCCI|nr:SDR family oxidoreductase [Mycolicibacterium chitae]MCV7104808.1 SDR family oxidoreductase [Mycolicibacterium chitae]BBZ03345.1 3-oxoacyl-ACP reductase [Mycolicibacterium chitae]VEG46794.1 short-chain dehydrogenase [Mycolicibacterium chitae]
MDLGLTGRTAVVLGTGGGIGRGIAEALAAEGALVASADRNLQAAKETAAALGGTAAPFVVELGDRESERTLIDEVQRDLGPVDILVNNTGGPPSTTATEVPVDTWRDYFESMVASVIHLSDLVLPGMRRRGWGRLITSTSSGVVVPIPLLGISNTLRSALLGWSKTVAREVGPDGVTSNVVIPGRIASQSAIDRDVLRAQQQDRTVEEVQKDYLVRIPARRYGTPREYGDAVAFLASARAGYINGTMLRVDGGMIESVF